MFVVALVAAAGSLLCALVVIRILDRVGTRIEEVRSTGQPPTREALEEDAAYVREQIEWFAAPERQGRDTPSPGLRASQVHLARHFHALGLTPIAERTFGDPGRGLLADALAGAGLPSYAVPMRAYNLEFGQRPLLWPREDTRLEIEGLEALELGVDFMPLSDGFTGAAEGPLVLVGYGIHSKSENYDDLAGLDLEGAVAVIVQGEPRIEGRFGGEDVTAEASVWNKLDALADAGAAGALVLRGSAAPGDLAFHASRASWIPPTFDRVRDQLPTLVLSKDAGARLLGVEVSALESEVSRTGAPPGATLRERVDGRRVSLFAALTDDQGECVPTVAPPLANVCAALKGPESEDGPLILVGAHLDHVGVGPRGRVAFGADDNGSGAAALMLMASRLAADPPAAEVWFAGFTGEEDGLLGSRDLASRLRTGRVALMVNLDMIGRGPGDSAVVLRGAPDAASLEALDELILAATDAPGHGLRTVRRVDDASFFQRSDHYAFHEVGVPNVFLFEDWPLREGVYHTWRDTPETVDPLKVARTARFGEVLVRAAAGRSR